LRTNLAFAKLPVDVATDLDELRARFDELVPALTARATELVARLPEPRPQPSELVEATWRIVCSRKLSADALRADATRELECAAHNAALRRLLDAGSVDRALELLLPQLRVWAQNLSRGLPPPGADPDDLVQDAFVKLRRAPSFAAADNPLGYAFRAVKNLVVDRARRARASVELVERHLPTVGPETSPERLDAILERAGLTATERCMLTRVVFEQIAVTAAQRECGGPPGAPYYVLEKMLDKVARSLGIDRSKRR
jgi:DNA-directed RNA polymerase specialized sigma24 family protein